MGFWGFGVTGVVLAVGVGSNGGVCGNAICTDGGGDSEWWCE